MTDLSSSVSNPTPPVNPPRRSGWARFWSGRRLAIQVLVLGMALTLVLLAGVWAWPRWTQGAPWSAAVLILVATSGMAVSLAAALWTQRVAGRLDAVAREAVLVRRADILGERNFSLSALSPEWLRAERSLGRLVDRMRARQRALLTRNAELGQQLDERTHTLSALQDLSIKLGTNTDVQGLIEEALDALEQTIEYSSASVWGRDTEHARGQVVLLGYRAADPASEGQEPGSMAGLRLSRSNLERYEQIERERQPVVENHVRHNLLSWLWEKVIDDARTSALYRSTRSWMAVPLSVGDSVLGVLRVDHEQPDYFNGERVRLLMAVASQTALAMRHAQTLKQAKEAAVIGERNRIARDLHDAVSQTLFAANVIAGNLTRDAQRMNPQGSPNSGDLEDQARALERLNRSALSEMRMLMYELRPNALESAPMAELLQYAVTAMGSRGDFEVELNATQDGVVPAPVRIELYRIAQEALSNIARHSGARKVVVQWDARDQTDALLRIVDDGVGFDPDIPKPGHFGLENMRVRAANIGARFTLASAPGMGAELRVQLGDSKS